MTRGGTPVVLAIASSCALGGSGCQADAPPRPQVVIVVDTTAPLVGQIAADDQLSPDAAIDSVRVDVYVEGGDLLATQEFVAPDRRDWPLSFGVVAGDTARSLTLRIRGFRAMRASGTTEEGALGLSPPIAATIDRMVDLQVQQDGLRTVRVVLDGACFGRPVSFLSPRTTCVDEARLQSSPSEGIEEISDEGYPETLAGTWLGAREKACHGSPSQGRVCVPGGFSLLGDRDLVGFDLRLIGYIDPTPLRPVMISPFWMDETEFTVGRFRALVQQGLVKGELPWRSDEADPNQFCTWNGVDDLSRDTLPLNCITSETAAEVCRLVHGELPSEAQWEHAARGRGRGRDYPWGNEEADCCMVSMGRYGSIAERFCDGLGPEPVGSHRPSEACGQLGDASIDGVLDLAGSLSEFVRDVYKPYDAPCWSRDGILQDPVCLGEGSNSSRGGGFYAAPMTLLSALRFSSGHGGAFGFRCVYGDEG